MKPLLYSLVIIVALGLFFAYNDQNSEINDDLELAKIFEEAGVKGTIIIQEKNSKNQMVFNSERANQRLSPASTFKIANSIIAVESGILKDQTEIIKWDGKKRFLDAWNKDQNLKTAFRSSCVWFYQELAKRTGKDRYREMLAKFYYGNQYLGDDITTFWLVQPTAILKITPLEQLSFLQNFYNKKLPISDRTYDIVKDIMLQKETEEYKLYFKTGAATKDWKGHGWYVGFVESKGKTWFFVTNILINSFHELKLREELTLKALKKKNIIN